MKVFTPEISWHQKEPVFSVDFCKASWKLASGGADFTVKIWNVKEDAQGNIGLDFMANLDRHSKPVNVVRFSPDGKYLASAGDDCIIIIWKLAEDVEPKSQETMIGAEEVSNKETWTVHKMLRRGHLEDIYDLAWSPDGQQLISGSVDNSAIIWDVNKGQYTNIIKDHKHYVQGVCWDPRGQYVATHSSDRTCKIYSLSKNKCVKSIDRASFNITNASQDEPKSRTCKLFMDETMQSFFRRCTFSPDGLLLVLPGGLNHSGEKPVKATYVFTRGNLNKPALCLPGPKKATVGACFCPIAFENMEENVDKENGSIDNGIFRLPYRLCYAVATLDSVVFYDTQHHYPFGFVSGVHYASLTDMTWSSDGRVLVVSSLDGYCSFISFKDGELGKPVTFDPMEYVTNKMKARKEARKEAKKEQVTERPSPAIVIPIPDKEQTTPNRNTPVQKDQPTLHQFITPVRKRKRPSGYDATPPNTTPGLKGIGNQGSPIDLTSSPNIHPTTSSQDQPKDHSSKEDSSTVKTQVRPSSGGNTPRRANLLTLGFQPISKSPKTPTDKQKQTVDDVKNPPQSKATQPRRVSLTTLGAGTATANQVSGDSGLSAAPQPVQSTAQAVKPTSAGSNLPRRVPFTSLSVKRDHTGVTKSSGSNVPLSPSAPISMETSPAATSGITGTEAVIPTLETTSLVKPEALAAGTKSAGIGSSVAMPAGVAVTGTKSVLSSPSKNSPKSSPKQVRRVNFVTLSSPKSDLSSVQSTASNGTSSPKSSESKPPRRVQLVTLPSVGENVKKSVDVMNLCEDSNSKDTSNMDSSIEKTCSMSKNSVTVGTAPSTIDKEMLEKADSIVESHPSMSKANVDKDNSTLASTDAVEMEGPVSVDKVGGMECQSVPGSSQTKQGMESTDCNDSKDADGKKEKRRVAFVTLP